MASVDGPCPLLLVLWEEEEEEEEEEEASTSSWCADTTLWARVPLSLFVGWCAVFPSFVDRPEMLGIMAGMYQKDNSTLVVVHGSGVCIAVWAGYDAPRRFPRSRLFVGPWRFPGLSSTR